MYLWNTNLEGHRGSGIRSHLVCYQNSNVVLFRDLLQLGQHLSKALLSLGKLATSREVYSEESHQAVYDQQLEDAGLLVELGAHEVQQLHLLLAGVGAAVEDVVQHRVLVQVEPVRDGP